MHHVSPSPICSCRLWFYMFAPIIIQGHHDYEWNSKKKLAKQVILMRILLDNFALFTTIQVLANKLNVVFHPCHVLKNKRSTKRDYACCDSLTDQMTPVDWNNEYLMEIFLPNVAFDRLIFHLFLLQFGWGKWYEHTHYTYMYYSANTIYI